MLSIVEELFLLALNEEKGTILSFVKKTLPYALTGAILAELALQGKVCSNDKQRLELLDSAPLGDEILDDALREFQSSEKPRKLSYWVSQFSAKPKKLRERLGESLVTKNVLYEEDRHYFRSLPISDSEMPYVPSKFDLKSPLRAMIFTQAEVDHRSLAMLKILGASEMLNLIFTQDELPIAKRRIHEDVLRAALTNPAMQTVEEIESAVVSSIEDELD
jgi:hypothetical protein